MDQKQTPFISALRYSLIRIYCNTYILKVTDILILIKASWYWKIPLLSVVHSENLLDEFSLTMSLKRLVKWLFFLNMDDDQKWEQGSRSKGKLQTLHLKALHRQHFQSFHKFQIIWRAKINHCLLLHIHTCTLKSESVTELSLEKWVTDKLTSPLDSRLICLCPTTFGSCKHHSIFLPSLWQSFGREASFSYFVLLFVPGVGVIGCCHLSLL